MPTNRPSERSTAGAVVGIIGGLVLLIVGLVLRGHYAPLNAICASPLGSVGQAVVPNAQNQCSLDGTLLTLGDLFAWVGGFLLLGAIITVASLRSRARAGTGWQRPGVSLAMQRPGVSLAIQTPDDSEGINPLLGSLQASTKLQTDEIYTIAEELIDNPGDELAAQWNEADYYFRYGPRPDDSMAIYAVFAHFVDSATPSVNAIWAARLVALESKDEPYRLVELQLLHWNTKRGAIQLHDAYESFRDEFFYALADADPTAEWV